MTTKEESEFTDTEAKRSKLPLMLGVIAPTGAGKTVSSLRMGFGIRRVTGGEVFLVDSDNRRSLLNADRFKFRHVDLGPPFDSLRYLRAAEYAVKRGAGVVIFDHASAEHDAMLAFHSDETDRLAKEWKVSHGKAQMAAWRKPKDLRREMIQGILQLPIASIFCFRAKPKLKIVPGKDPEPRGFMAIAGDELLFEMTANFLLLPGSKGTPIWTSEEEGERATIKLPWYFEPIFEKPEQLSELHGEKMALWMEGEPRVEYTSAIAELEAAPTVETLKSALDKYWALKSWSVSERGRLKNASIARKAALEKTHAGELLDRREEGP